MCSQKKKIVKSSLFLAGQLGIFLLPLAAHAAESFDALSFKPANDQGFYLNVEQSQTLGRKGFALGVSGDYSNDSLDLKNSSGAKLQDVIDNQIGMHIGAAFGLADWVNLGVGFSGTPYQQFTEPVTLAEDDGARFGDIALDAKIRLANNKSSPIGLALVPFITFPTGSDEHFVGNGKFTGGGKLVLDTARISDRVSFSVNAGGQFRDKATLSPGAQEIGHQFLYGAGVNVGIAKSVQFVAEATGWTPFGDFFKSNNRNLSLDGALKILPGEKHRVQLIAGGGMGLMKEAGVPDWRTFVTLAYHRPTEKEAPAPEVVTVEVPVPYPVVVETPQEEVISTQDIHFAFNKALVQPESHRVLDGILLKIQNKPEVEKVRIEGHTDSVGSDEYNLQLSEQRANAVRTYLISKGYSADKLLAVGMGETAPIADNTTKSGRAQNRRVEFHLQIQPGSNVKEGKKETPSPTFEEGGSKKNR